MNWDRIQTNWNQYKTSVREAFVKLTDDDLEKIDGRRDQFLGKLQERYGYSRDIADQKLTDFATKLSVAIPTKDRAATGTTPSRKGEKR